MQSSRQEYRTFRISTLCQPSTSPGRAGACVRAHRYALALATGDPLGSALALHECDVPVCVKVAAPHAIRQHVGAGTQRDNMIRMAYTRRGGGRPVAAGRERICQRRERSVALREAVRDGCDGERVAAALLGVTRRCGDPASGWPQRQRNNTVGCAKSPLTVAGVCRDSLASGSWPWKHWPPRCARCLAPRAG